MRPPLPLTVEIAPGSDPSASPGTWEFTAEDVHWRAKTEIQLTAGRDDEDDETKPGSAELVLDDRAGHLSPRNVLGKWYGALNRNTPLRILLDTVDDPFTRVGASGWGIEPVSGYEWLHTNPAMFAVTGAAATHTNGTAGTANYALLNGNVGPDVDVYNSASISATPTGGSWVHATILRRDADNRMYRAYTEFGTDGMIQVKVTRYIGSTTELTGLTATGVSYAPGDMVHTHARAIGRTIQIRVWKNADPEPDTWHASADDGMIVGPQVGFYEWRIATNPGDITLTVDDFQVRTSLWTGQVPSWPVRWPDKSGNDCIAPVSAGGVLRWLEQTQSPLTDPISQQLSAQNPMGYWTLQDGSDAKTAGSARPGRAAASVVDGSFGTDDAPGGATTSLALSTANTSRLTGSVSGWTVSGGYAVMAYFRFPTLPPASPARNLLTITAPGSVAKWVITVDSATINATGYDLDNAEVTSTGGNLWGIDPTRWFAVQLETEERPADNETDYAMIWHQLGSETFFVAGDTFTGIVGPVSQVTVNAVVDGMLTSHLWVGPHTLPFVDSTFMKVSSGYAGETDTERVARVLGDAGIEVLVHAGDGIQLGPQPHSATPLAVARDAEVAGWGTLYESGPVLGYLPYSARINPAVAMELDWAAGHIAEPPEPDDDDLDLINRWTSRRPRGSERTADDPGSIERNRVYADGGETNVFTDDQLDDDAGWHVAVGARDVLRWPRIEIDLIRNPDLIPQWLGCRVGSRVTIANLPAQLAGEVADLIITGYQTTIRQHRWRVVLTCAPSTPWTEVGVWGSSLGDALTSMLAEDLTIGETAIDVTCTWLEDTWYSPGTTDERYILDVNGEPITVTATSAVAGSPGAYTQTITGIRHPTLAKTHSAGEPVRLYQGVGRWGIRH
jgi:hypothetical protein